MVCALTDNPFLLGQSIFSTDATHTALNSNTGWLKIFVEKKERMVIDRMAVIFFINRR
jgi:hypothetical protein